MKFRGDRFGVQAGVHSRKPGSAPELGRLAKIPGYGRREVSRGRRRRGSQQEQQQPERQDLIVKWSIVIGGLSLMVLAVVFAFWLRPRLHRANDTTGADQGGAADAQSRVASKFQSPTQEEALALVKKALALRNPAAVEGLIRPGESTTSEVVDFLKTLRTNDGEITDYIWLSSLYKNSLPLEGVQVVFASKDKPKSRMAILTPDKNGIWKMDFAAFARWGKPSWPDLLEKKADAAIVRVHVAKDRYYNGPFADDRKWAAYKLASPDIDDMLVGYCKLGSAQHRVLEKMWAHGEISVSRATLEIRHVEGSDRWQFEIARVLAEDWVMGEKPLDETLP